MKISTEQLRKLAQLRRAYQDSTSQKDLNRILEDAMKEIQKILADNGVDWTTLTTDDYISPRNEGERSKLFTPDDFIKALDEYLKNRDSITKNETPKQITVKEASKIYNIPLWTLRNYISRRLIPIRKIGNRVYLETDKLETWLKKFDIPPYRYDKK